MQIDSLSSTFSFSKNAILRTVALTALITLSSCAVYNSDIDKQIGAQNAQQVEQQMGLYQPEALSFYVQAVGQRLVDELSSDEFTFQFSIIDDPTPNAFALPGGYIYITRGLLILMQSEDELANVLAHEIIHVTERHSIKQMHSSVLPSLIELPGNLVAGLLNENLGNLINAPISAGNALLLSGYSRRHESESDKKGVALAAKAGYQPAEMADILIRLNQSVTLSTNKIQQKSYFDSHPFTDDRVEHINKEVSTLAVIPTKKVSSNFTETLDGLTYGENPAKGLFIAQQFLHPDLQFVMDFPAQWTLQNQPQAVVGINEQEHAFIALTLATNQKNALENAQAFQETVKKETGNQLDYDTLKLEWGGTAYFSSFADKRQRTPTTIQLLWVDLKGQTYQISSMGHDQFNQVISESMFSFRPLLDSEKETVMKKVVKVVNPQQNDSLLTLSEREKNVGDIKYIGLINDLTQSQMLSESDDIKIITVTPYLTE